MDYVLPLGFLGSSKAKKPETVNEALEVFNKALTDLEHVAALQSDREKELSDKIAELNVERSSAAAEVIRANATLSGFRKLLNSA